MSASRDDILAFLDLELETTRYRDFGPIGLQVIGRDQVELVACAVSSSLEVFAEAARIGASMLLVHHGMFWDKDSRVVGPWMRRRLELLFAADITLAAYHLPLDGHQRIGNNALLAARLGVSVTGWCCDHYGVPLAVRGTLEAPTALDAFSASVAMLVGRQPLVFEGGPEKLQRIAICSGRPSGFVQEAAALSADVVLTGEAHEDFRALAAELGVSIVCAGHHATETFGVRAAGELVAERFDVKTTFLNMANPV